MLNLPDQETSILKPSGFNPTYPALGADLAVDTVIVGGGIAGISAAYLLKEAGQTVVVLEKNAIGSGTTGHTTGKVTSQHNIIYSNLIERLGKKAAQNYASANQTAVEEIRKFIKKDAIDCGWQDADNYVYTADERRIKEFRNEAKAAASLDLPASFEIETELPFKITGAVKFSGQGHFSAQKYIESLAAKINGDGSYVFEQSKVTGFHDGRPCKVAANNFEVVSKNIIVATREPTLPLAARGLYCVMEYPQNSYLIAGKSKVKLNGMYISPDDNHYSILPLGDTILVGGENHIPGTHRSRPRQQKLADYATEHFGVEKIDYRWHARDYLGYDQMPLIGKLYPWSRHLYVTTAFMKWGLSTSMVSAMILRDLIMGEHNPWADTFDSMRISPITSIPRVAAEYISGRA